MSSKKYGFFTSARVNPTNYGISRLVVEKVELNGVVKVNVHIGEEKLFSESKNSRLFNALLME